WRVAGMAGRFGGARVAQRPARPEPQIPTPRRGSMVDYFFDASLDLAGSATQARLPSLPALSSHFILAFSQSALLVGLVACCAMAVGANASSAITAVMGNSFISGLRLFASSIHRRRAIGACWRGAI